MPIIRCEGREIECPFGANLRRALLDAGLKLYNGPMRAIHCRGLGTCGTCAVRLTADSDGGVSAPTAVERWRLGFPPHSDGLAQGLRLACQCRVEGDLVIEKLAGWWGQTATSAPDE